MPKSWKRARREAIDATWPFRAQFEALVEEKLGNPGKVRQLASDLKTIKANNPKPGDSSPDVGAVHRLSVLKVLQNNHGTVYTRAGGAITYEDVETEIAAISDPNARRNAWLDYQEEWWTKDHPLVTLLADEFGLDSDDIDDIFDAAAAHRLAQGT